MHIVETPMNKRMMTVLMAGLLVTTVSGCGRMRNFLFGRGARCGLCNQVSLPPNPLLPRAVPAAPQCNQPTYVQPQYGQPQAAPAPGPCSCSPAPCNNACGSGYAPNAYGTDSYGPGVCGSGVGQGTVMPGQPIYGGEWTPREGYQSNYPVDPYDNGYKIDKDGARILNEEPLPPGAISVEP